MNTSGINPNTQSTPTWSAYNPLVCEDNTKIQRTAFFPVIPYPVTEYSSVYTAMCNFLIASDQLDQEDLLIACNEGVDHIARHIQLLEPEKFKHLVLLLGNFHMIKIFLAIIGKYLKESGVNHIFIETESFGLGVIEQVLGGTHYARSTKGVSMLVETLQRFQLQAFISKLNLNENSHSLSDFKAIQDTLAEENYSECKSLYDTLINTSDDFIAHYKSCIMKKSKESTAF